MSHHNAVAGQLQERLHKLLDRVGRIEGDLRAPHDRDWPDRATELENDDVLQGLDELSRAEVRRILLALKQIENGHYGVCSTCGQPLSTARLAAVPTATTCVGCARQ